MLSLRIVSVDFYLASPIPRLDPTYSLFHGLVVHQVPVIRVFGITPSGDKGCLHVHGVLPYLYVPIKEGVRNIDEFMYQLSESFDKQLNRVYDANHARHNIFKITPVKGIPIYGFHKSTRDYLKIYFYKPSHIKKAAALLLDGVILGESFQPHEAHIPYILQFFIDYNLYGMSFLNIRKISFRNEGCSVDGLEKVTFCKVEADALAEDILNVSQVTGTTLSNPGLVHIWEEERVRRREEEMSSDPSLQTYENLSGCFRSENEMEDIARLREALKKRLKDRIRCNKLPTDDSLFLESSFRESHCSEESTPIDARIHHFFNAFKRKLLEEYLQEENHAPDVDSILGSQQVDPEEISISDEETPDLSQAFLVSESEHSESDEEVIIDSSVVNYENAVDVEVRNLRTPNKFNKSNPSTPTRYTPLKISVTKSPRSKMINKAEEKEELGMYEVGTPESKTFFEKFNLDATLTHLSKKFSKSGYKTKDTSDCKRIDVPMKTRLRDGEATTCSSDNNKLSSAKKSLNFGQSEVEEDQGTDQITSLENTEAFRNEIKGEMLASHSDISFSGYDDDKRRLEFRKEVELKYFTTLLEPPSVREVIQNLSNFGFHREKAKKPYYSNFVDDVFVKEISEGSSTVTSIRNLGEFRGTFHLGDKFQNFSNKNPTGRKNISFNQSRIVTMYPLKNPPSSVDASNWSSEFNAVKEKAADELLEEDNLEWFDGGNENYHFSDSTMFGSSSFVNKLSQCEGNESPEKIVENLPQPSPLLNRKSNSCFIENVTPSDESMQNNGVSNANQSNSENKFITLFVMELHIETRGNFNPDPEHDQIKALFYCITNDVPLDSVVENIVQGVIVVDPNLETKHSYNLKCLLTIVPSEVDLLNKVLEIIHLHDPDIFVGYETQMLSWNFLIQRGNFLNMNLVSLLSRIKPVEGSSYEINEFYELKISGRIILNVWRLMRHEVALMSYSFENVVYHLLRRRLPHYSFKTLTSWWNSTTLERLRTLKYYIARVEGTVKLLEEVDFVRRTSELATLFGIQFYEVLSRGSQFRVESIMLRMAKSKNYVSVSPSIQQRGAMRAPAFLPLIMEPQSRFFEDPVIVLDFQSLYPSMIIAYNYCFSTCLGLLQGLLEKDNFIFGCTNLSIDPKEVYRFENELHISPAGVVFVNDSIRKGILPQMLEEILETRLMVKNSMKRHKNNKILYQTLDARQLGLKLIANVTYGYTSANFSGRMPSVEIADSVVSKGRETLQRAIKLVEKTKRWDAEVVYGDTDSMFVLCRGKTRQEAFEIGQEIADSVTRDNPKPVKLKLEKVYHPCILLTKKRYVGYMYESPNQMEPAFDAKGIETVRRDGCPAASKILEKSLKILFESYDVSKVKSYVNQQLAKIVSGRLYLQDLIFAKEFRGVNGYKPGACVPSLKLAKEWIAKDKRSVPKIGERVGYVIIAGPPGVPLIQLVRAPHELLTNSSLKINAEYYITKAILPPLDRCFSLMGVNVFAWYRNLPKKRYHKKHLKADVGLKKATLSQYFLMENCIICHEITSSTVCQKCTKNRQLLSSTLLTRMNDYERKYCLLQQVCGSCSDRAVEEDCISLDCPVLFKRMDAAKDYQEIPNLRDIFSGEFSILDKDFF